MSRLEVSEGGVRGIVEPWMEDAESVCRLETEGEGLGGSV